MHLPGEPATPALLVDRTVLDRNVQRMAELARRRGIALRPHAKTHKSPDIARLQLAAGATGLTVATVSEAEVFAAAGFEDLFVAYPLWVDADRGRRLRGVLESAVVSVGVDTVEGARALAAQLGGADGRLRVLVEVDSGQHRSGVTPDRAGELAEQVAHLGLPVLGVFTFPGHSYLPGSQAQVAGQEADALATAAAAVRDRGLEVTVVSGGSTPTADLEGGPLTEMRPGVYVFGDAQQWELGTAEPDQLALTCLATVVSTVAGRVVLDSGSKVLGADRPGWATGFGRLLDHPGARLTQLSEHHAVVDWPGPLPRPGDRVRVVPNHVCSAVNLADELHVVEEGVLVGSFPVAARGANT
ncbi:D-TA family PLP-dependent enzyme [Nocardioides mesophilus]|uniref:D-TA family PLP-dependent enzyme n=1 Tax=Nocardioides mesophilus TaxID=433659 RepID=A0A7G9RAT4_9ACTN|nr:D-TA family PLP-dependent enzyme [Nocardioides mesophilus]QNN52709.1 D-TA family PLP-dependent enzyme [Nocardioides mesophilus]